MAESDRHFETATLQANLKQRAVRSGLIAVAAQPLKLGIGIGGTMILARLLVPADFGLLAMVQPLLSIVDSLSNLGLETATVQRQDLNREQASAVFWLSLKINALVISGMLLAGPLLAWFYGRSELTGIILCLAVGAASLCLSFQHLSLLKRQMQFELLTTIEVAAMFLSTGIAVLAGWQGLGYWALALQLTLLQSFKSIAYWCCCDWRPKRQAKASGLDREIRSILSYGAHLTGFRCITRIGMHMDRILLGYFSGASALGLYSVAYQWAYFPFWQIYFPLFDVAISSFSRSFSEPKTYRAYCRTGLMLVFAICMPALAYVFVSAREITLLVLGERWLAVVPLLRVLLIAVFVGSFYRVTKWIYVSAGETQRQFQWSLIHTPVMIAAVAIGIRWGSYGVAVGYTVGVCLLSYPAVAYCVRRSPLSMGDFLSAAWRPATASLFSAAVLYLCQTNLPSHSLLIVDLGIEFVAYSLLYSATWLLLPGGYSDAKDAVSLLLTKK